MIGTGWKGGLDGGFGPVAVAGVPKLLSSEEVGEGADAAIAIRVMLFPFPQPVPSPEPSLDVHLSRTRALDKHRGLPGCVGHHKVEQDVVAVCRFVHLQWQRHEPQEREVGAPEKRTHASVLYTHGGWAGKFMNCPTYQRPCGRRNHRRVHVKIVGVVDHSARQNNRLWHRGVG